MTKYFEFFHFINASMCPSTTKKTHTNKIPNKKCKKSHLLKGRFDSHIFVGVYPTVLTFSQRMRLQGFSNFSPSLTLGAGNTTIITQLDTKSEKSRQKFWQCAKKCKKLVMVPYWAKTASFVYKTKQLSVALHSVQL